MRTPKPIYYWDYVYRANIYISYGVKPEILKKQIKRSIGFDYLAEGIEQSNGRHVVFENKGKNGDSQTINWIWTRKKDIAALAHECLHATYTILNNADIKLTDDTEEAYCYYLESIIDKLKGLK